MHRQTAADVHRRAGVVDTGGFVVSATENVISSQTIAKDKIAELANARQAIITTILNTGETGTEIVN